MPFARPTLQEQIDRISADIDLELEGVDSTLRRSNTAAISRAAAGLTDGLYGNLAWLADQLFTATQDEEELLKDGADYGITRLPADYAEGNLIVPGVNGSIIPEGTVYTRTDGAEYATTADATIAVGTATVPARAITIGSGGNTAAGAVFTLSTTLEGVEGTATVDVDGIVGGVEIEGIEAYRARVWEYKRRKPSGGNRYDYIRWAESIRGVAAAWVVSMGQGPGTVDIVCLSDPAIVGTIYPPDALLAEVRAYIVTLCQDTVKYLRVLSPEPSPLNITLSVTPNTEAVKVAVASELADLVERYADPDKRVQDPAITIPLSQINEAASLAAGETDHEISLPDAAVSFTGYQHPIMGVVTWV